MLTYHTDCPAYQLRHSLLTCVAVTGRKSGSSPLCFSLAPNGLPWTRALAPTLPVWLSQGHWSIVDDEPFYARHTQLVSRLGGAPGAVGRVAFSRARRAARDVLRLEGRRNLYWTADGWAERFRMDPASNGVGQTMEEVRAMPELPLTDLLAYFGAVRAVTRQYLAQATDADLSREYPRPRGGTVTGSWVLGHLLVEESQHLGQVALLRGMIRGLGT